MEQPASPSPVVVTIDPGMVSRLFVRRDGVTLASVAAAHGIESLPALIEMAAETFDVDRWLVEVSGFQRLVLQNPGVVAVCERLGISLEPVYPVAHA